MTIKINSFVSVRILMFFIFALLQISCVSAYDAHHTFCKDWTICSSGFCAPVPEECPEEQPFRLLSECGCCEFCSDSPRIGPSGTCGVDVKCRHFNPICGENTIISIDYSGCCRVCKSLLEEGQECKSEGRIYAVCNVGLQCVDGICLQKVQASV